MSKIKVALIGAGQRGKDIYGNYVLNHRDEIEFVAVAEPNKLKRDEFKEKHNIKEELCFENFDEFFKEDKLADAIIIATPDNEHFVPASKAIEKGYHILLEKPMANNPEESVKLGELAKNHKNIFMICHVLRYTPFYSELKSILDTKIIGNTISIQHNENIGYFHFAHSFVRGNWRNSKLSSPLMLQKSCHDMDILLWLVGSDCKKIGSFGKLSYFNKENKPKNAGSRCVDCSIEKECPYSAPKLYFNNIGLWPTTVISEIQTKEAVEKAVAEGPYGRCVYECDNDVVDHQSTILEFENGVTVDFNLSAFTNKTFRNLKIMGTMGEIIGNDVENKIEIQLFDSNEKKIIEPKKIGGGHGGGDTGIMEDFIKLIKSGKNESLTSASKSVQSHMMAFAADESRLNDRIVNIKEYYNKFNS